MKTRMFASITASLLVAVSSVARAADDPAVDEAVAKMSKIMETFDAEMNAYMEKARKAAPDERRSLKRPDPSGPAAEIVPLLKTAMAHEGALKAVQWMVRYGRDAEGFEFNANTYELIAKHHMQSESLGEFCVMLGRHASNEPTKAFLHRVIKESTNEDAKGMALFTLAFEAERRDPDAFLKYAGQLVKEHPNLEFRGRKLAGMLEGKMFAAQNLAIGKEAPDIEGEDVDGVAFKLSDYRGKVVVIDFWGDW